MQQPYHTARRTNNNLKGNYFFMNSHKINQPSSDSFSESVRRQLSDRLSDPSFWRRLVLILLVLNLIPVYGISVFNHASADDFVYGLLVHHAWKATHSPAAWAAAFVQQMRDSYASWQGSYMAVFFSTLMPAVFGERGYIVSTWFLVTLYTFSNFFFFRKLAGSTSRHSAGTSRHSAAAPKYSGVRLPDSTCVADVAAALVTLVGLNCLPRAIDMFFWYNGAVNYITFYSLTMIVLGFFMQLLRDGGLHPAKLVLAAVLAFAGSGGNYVPSLVHVELMVLLTLLFLISCVRRTKFPSGTDSYPETPAAPAGSTSAVAASLSPKFYNVPAGGRAKIAPDGPAPPARGILQALLICTASAAGFLISLSAPGNKVRMAKEASAEATSLGLPQIIGKSLWEAGLFLQQNVTVFVVLMLAFLIPFLWNAVRARDSSFLTNGLQSVSWKAEAIQENKSPSRSAAQAGALQLLSHIPAVIFLLAAFCLFASSFAPNIYVDGSTGPVRTADYRFFLMLVLLVVTEAFLIRKMKYALLGYGPEVSEALPGSNVQTQKSLSELRIPLLVSVTVLYLFAAAFYVVPKDNRELLTSICAARSILIGEASAYDKEMCAREQTLQSASAEEDVAVPAIENHPRLLYSLSFDITDDPEYWVNETVADYYGVHSVRVAAGNP